MGKKRKRHKQKASKISGGFVRQDEPLRTIYITIQAEIPVRFLDKYKDAAEFIEDMDTKIPNLFTPWWVVDPVLADLDIDPPEIEGEDCCKTPVGPAPNKAEHYVHD